MSKEKSNLSYFVKFPLLLIFTGFLVSCATLQNKTPFGTNAHLPENCTLTKNFKPSANTEYFCYENKDFPIIYHVVKINLAKNVKIAQFPLFKQDGSADFMFTKDFAKQNNATIAINTTQFSYEKPNIIGIGIEDSKQFSDPISKYSAFIIDSTGPKIIEQKDIANFTDISFASGGFFTILKDGKHFGEYLQNRDSRTALGISKDCQTLTILVVEGEFSVKSEGLSFFECAEILQKFDVWNALQFDSGSSSSLIINQCNVMNYIQLRKTPINLAIIDE